MNKNALIIFPFVSLLFFPFSISILFACLGAFVSPLIPFAAGLFAEALYGAPQASSVPIYALSGLILTLFAFVVHKFVETSIIKG